MPRKPAEMLQLGGNGLYEPASKPLLLYLRLLLLTLRPLRQLQEYQRMVLGGRLLSHHRLLPKRNARPGDDEDWDASVDDDFGLDSRPDPVTRAGSSLLYHFVTRSSSHQSPYGAGGHVATQPAAQSVPSFDALYPDLAAFGIGSGEPQSLEHPVPYDSADVTATAEMEEINALRAKTERFIKVSDADTVDLVALRKLLWNGIPDERRPLVWQLLLGYLPTSTSRRELVLARKRQEYADGIAQVFLPAAVTDNATLHQIKIDVPRTLLHLRLYTYKATQQLLVHVLYLWAVRHPASGYVQGINDLVTPLLQTFLKPHVPEGVPLHEFDPGVLPEQTLSHIEADTFWCLLKILDTIQDLYIHEQPGIRRQVAELELLTARIDAPLHAHLKAEGVEYIQFAFRWMNCLLMRELPVHLVVRAWDTYMLEQPLGFAHFHVYVCCAYLVRFSSVLREMEFQEIIMFLQSPPSKGWSEKDVELMLSEAFIWQSLYKSAGAHLR